MWQDDSFGDAPFIDACLESLSTLAGHPQVNQATDQH
jgi:hypothetical protein